MKIKITEDQAKRLNLINENNNPLTNFESLCKIKIQEINKLYNNITSLSLYEILHKKVDMNDVSVSLSKISNDLDTGNRIAYQYINSLPDSDLDNRIDSAHDLVQDKLTSIELIVMDLEKLQLLTEEHNLTKDFEDIKPIDITNIQ